MNRLFTEIRRALEKDEDSGNHKEISHEANRWLLSRRQGEAWND